MNSLSTKTPAASQNKDFFFLNWEKKKILSVVAASECTVPKKIPDKLPDKAMTYWNLHNKF